MALSARRRTLSCQQAPPAQHRPRLHMRRHRCHHGRVLGASSQQRGRGRLQPRAGRVPGLLRAGGQPVPQRAPDRQGAPRPQRRRQLSYSSRRAGGWLAAAGLAGHPPVVLAPVAEQHCGAAMRGPRTDRTARVAATRVACRCGVPRAWTACPSPPTLWSCCATQWCLPTTSVRWGMRGRGRSLPCRLLPGGRR